jgi:hypothetical protein
MKLKRPEKVIEQDGRVTLSHPVTLRGVEHELFLRLPGEPVNDGIEPFLAMLLIPAMREGMDLILEEPISPKLLLAIDKIQQQFVDWFPDDFRKVKVCAEPLDKIPEQPIDVKSGCFFSGGVDSFYSVLKHREELSGLIYVHGMDVGLHRTDLRERVRSELLTCAESLKLPLIELETNARQIFDDIADWGRFYHGSLLGGVALALSSRFSKIIIAAGRTRDTLFPWGSHPDLDPLWSNERTEIIHDGLEACRAEKIFAIANTGEVMRHLRVCYHNIPGRYNCGNCEKCLRTMVVLRAAGVLDQYVTFENRLDLMRVASIPLVSKNVEAWVEENLSIVRKYANDPELEQALVDCLNRKYDRGLRRSLRRLWWTIKRNLYGKPRNSWLKS